jgi:hypothetical protein
MTIKTTRPYPICKRDGFPMVKIDGKLQCVAEYLDQCIGQKRVVDIIQREETFYYVFEDGHELPLLCFCCDEPLVVRDIKQSRLEGMVVDEITLEDGSEMVQFGLHFSRKGLSSDAIVDALSPLVAVHLRHPVGCPRHKKRRKR